MAKPKEVLVQAPLNTHELDELKRLNARLTSDLANRDNELLRLRNQHRDLEGTISNLRNEVTQTKTMINIKEDPTDWDALINQYKNKINQLNTQLSSQQRTIEGLQSEIHTKRVS